MRIQRMWPAVAATLVFSTIAGAQQAQPVERITFQQAIDIALRQNLTVKQAENQVELQNISASQQGQALRPNLGFSLSGGNAVGRSFNPSDGTISTQNTQSVNSSLNSSFTLYDFNRTRAAVQSARSSASASEADLSRTRQSTVFNVATDFVQLVSAQSQLDVQKENLASLQLQEAQIQRFADAGARPISDLYQQKANVASAQLSVTRAEAAVENAKMTLMQTLQLDPAKEYEFIPPTIPDAVGNANFNLDSLVSLAYAHRADIVAAQARVTAADQDARSAAAGRMPSLGVSGSYSTSGRSSARDSKGASQSFGDQFDQNRGGSVGLSMSLPIFDRGSTRLNRERASVSQENAQLALASSKQTVALEVRRAWYNVRSAQQQLASAQAALTAATQALDATQQRYNVGAATLLEVTQARAARVSAASNLSDARYNLVLNQAAIGYYTGELDPKNPAIIR